MPGVSDLRETLIKELTPLMNNCEYCIDDGEVSNCPKCMIRSQVADRILALLPTVPELRWDGDYLRIGRICVGVVEEEDDCDLCYGCFDDCRIISLVSEAEARAAVEAAVRKALGWEA